MKPLLIYVKYAIGDIVYLKTDPTPYPRIVVSYLVTEGQTLYRVDLMGTVTEHYHFELETAAEIC